MLKDIATLIFAVTGLGILILFGVVLYRPPKFLQKMKRFKFWQFEGEAEAVQVSTVVQPAPLALAGSSAEASSEGAIDAASPSTPDLLGEAFDALMLERKYDEGLALLRKHYVDSDQQELF